MSNNQLKDINALLSSKQAKPSTAQPAPSTRLKEESTDPKTQARQQVKQTKRVYRKVTPQVIAKFKALESTQGNGSQAVRVLEPDTPNAGSRAYTISKKVESSDVVTYIDNKLAEQAKPLMDRFKELIESPNESIAQKSVHYGIDQLKGKAISKSINRSEVINIDTVISGL